MDGNDPFDNTDIPMIILQNKLDLIDQDRLKDFQTKEKLDNFVMLNNFKAGFQVSAKNNKNIDEAMNYLVTEVMNVKNNRNLTNYRANDSLIKLSRHSVDTTARRSLMQRQNQDKCSC